MSTEKGKTFCIIFFFSFFPLRLLLRKNCKERQKFDSSKQMNIPTCTREDAKRKEKEKERGTFVACYTQEKWKKQLEKCKDT